MLESKYAYVVLFLFFLVAAISFCTALYYHKKYIDQKNWLENTLSFEEQLDELEQEANTYTVTNEKGNVSRIVFSTKEKGKRNNRPFSRL